MSELLKYMLNEFYNDIRPDLFQSVLDAINACDNAGEFDSNPSIITSFGYFITSLSLDNIPDTRAINSFMSDHITRRSASRPFFYHMTLPSSLFPEDNPTYPAAPSALPPQIQVPADFDPVRVPEFGAQTPRIVPRDILINDLEEGEILE